MFAEFLPPAPLEQTSLRNSLPPDNLSPQTDLHKRLRESERRIAFLIANQKYIQANALLQSIQYQLNEYYKAGPAVSKNMQTMRTLSKFKKREELALMHNQAVIMQASNNLERATDLLTVIIEEANHMIQSEQTRYGFLQQSDQSQRKAALENIAFWKHFLIRYYYFLALLTFQNAAHEISLASLMKGLDLIKELYRNQRQSSSKFIDTLHDETYTERLCQLQEAEELYLLCELRERVGHSKYLNIVSMNALVEMANALLEPNRSRKENPISFELFQFGKMVELELPSIQVILSNQFVPKQLSPLEFSKIALLVYQNLLSKIYSQHSKLLQNQYQKLKNAKNIILLHILIGILCHKYIPFCDKVDEILQQYRQMYKTKHHRQVANIYSLIELFGLSLNQLSDNNHACEDLSILQVHRTEQHKKKPNIKKVKSTIKHPTKSKSKQKKSPAPSSKEKTKKPVLKIEVQKIRQRQKKHRIKEEYMLKRQGHKPTRGMDHLLKAIHQNYRSFDSSLSKEKPKSPDQRAIKTETNIDHKPKQRVEKVKRR